MKSCNQCGKCCVKYSNGGLSASQSEIDSWEETRPDIFNYVQGGKIWMDPKTGAQIVRCPWLEESPHANDPSKKIYTCRIYYDRPEDCRLYPVTVSDMVRDECEMIEPKDLHDLKRAQKTLDDLMEDSRLPFWHDA